MFKKTSALTQKPLRASASESIRPELDSGHEAASAASARPDPFGLATTAKAPIAGIVPHVDGASSALGHAAFGAASESFDLGQSNDGWAARHQMFRQQEAEAQARATAVIGAQNPRAMRHALQELTLENWFSMPGPTRKAMLEKTLQSGDANVHQQMFERMVSVVMQLDDPKDHRLVVEEAVCYALHDLYQTGDVSDAWLTFSQELLEGPLGEKVQPNHITAIIAKILEREPSMVMALLQSVASKRFAPADRDMAMLLIEGLGDTQHGPETLGAARKALEAYSERPDADTAEVFARLPELQLSRFFEALSHGQAGDTLRALASEALESTTAKFTPMQRKILAHGCQPRRLLSS